MLFVLDNETSLGRLTDRIRNASAPDARLFSDVVANACQRALLLVRAGKAAQLKQFIEVGAWTEAALALVELDLPQWKPRRIVLDDGQWHCRLSAQPRLPDGFDDVVETSHDVLALAILSALVEARRHLATEKPADVPVAKKVLDSDPIRICCDNFS
jgi:hypothetical protein